MILSMLAPNLLELTYGFLESSFVDHSPSDVASKELLKLKKKNTKGTDLVDQRQAPLA